MKIQDELLTGIITDPQQLKKTGTAQPEGDFAALLEGELTQAQSAAQLIPGLKDINPLTGLAGIEALAGLQESAPLGGFSEQENRFMDELDDLLGVVDTYSMALAGQASAGEQLQPLQSGLKSAYNILDTISQKAQELKGMLSEIGNNPVLAGIVNELDVMATTEKFKFNRGDYQG